MRRLWMRWLLALSALVGVELGADQVVRLEVAVFLQVEATEEQRRAVRKALTASPSATRLVHVSREDAYAEFRQMFAHAQAAADPGPHGLPESFRFVLPDRRSFKAVESALGAMPGVHRVVCRPATPHP